MENREEILNGFITDTKNQIAAFDQKAGIMLTTIGIMFALITYFCGIFVSEAFKTGEAVFKWFYITFFILFCISAVFALACFTLVIVPRRKPKKHNSDLNAQKHINYYYDGASLKLNEFKELLDNYVADESVLIQQIINNDKICKRKHLFLIFGIFALIPFVVFKFAMITFIVFVF